MYEPKSLPSPSFSTKFNTRNPGGYARYCNDAEKKDTFLR
jgi:hypothetical protein